MQTLPSEEERNQLVELFKAGRHEELEGRARQLVHRFPDWGFAWKMLGVTLCVQGKESVPALRKASELLPDDAAAQSNLGVTLKNLGRLVEAEACYRRALSIKPDFADAHCNLGNTLKELGRPAEAEACYHKALAINPNFADAHYNLGNIRQDLGRPAEAEACYRLALAIDPRLAAVHGSLGNTLMELGRLAEAEECYRRALAIDPRLIAVHYNLGNICKELGRLTEAEACYREAVAIDPGLAAAHGNLGNTLMDRGRLAEAEICFRRALSLKPGFTDAHSNLLLCLNYTQDHTPLFCLEEARRYGRLLTHGTAGPFTTWSCPAEPPPLRVGLVSGDLRNHPVGYFLESLLTRLDPTRIELLAFPTQAKEDDLTSRIKQHFTAWRPVAGLNDEAAARLIHDQGVHLLLDLSGHTAHNRLPIFALRPAPVQVSWLGYVATTGVEQMDYLLADQVRIPEAHQGHFSETIHYLPDTRLCFTPPAVDLPVQPLPALANGYITFACFQSLTKISDAVLKRWGEILTALPHARMRLQCKQLADAVVRGQMPWRLQRQGIDPGRVAMRGPLCRERYLAAYAEVDMNLDTFPYPGATTTCEAIWMGVPTVTLAGDRMAARNGASVLTAAGLADWVATSEMEYVAKAVAMAGDVPRLALLRAGMRAKALASPLFDADRFARNFTMALWEMWRHHSAQPAREALR